MMVTIDNIPIKFRSDCLYKLFSIWRILSGGDSIEISVIIDLLTKMNTYSDDIKEILFILEMNHNS